VSPLAAILSQIVDNRRLKIEAQVGPATGDLTGAQAGGNRLVENEFSASLQRHRGRALIAEVKMGSPRIGSLKGRLDPLEQVRVYAREGAAALSVVVEPDFFFGSYELLVECRRQSGLPTLAKDFVVHPVQLEWAREAGADAVLLIAALFSDAELTAYADHARSFGLIPHNRNLETFKVDLDHSMELVGDLPAGALKVSESGIAIAADIDRLEKAGFDAFLVGESLLLADDPGAKLRELTARSPW